MEIIYKYKNNAYELGVLYNVFISCAIVHYSRYKKIVDVSIF